MEDSDNNFYHNSNNINTDGTNFMVDLLANSDKLKERGARWHYNKDDPTNNVEEDMVDDDIHNYTKPPPFQPEPTQQHHMSANNHMETLSDKNQEKSRQSLLQLWRRNYFRFEV